MLSWTNNDRALFEDQLQFEADTDFKTIDILEAIHLKYMSVLNNSAPMRVEKISDGTLPSLTVIVVPRSHDDPDWLKTVDVYFKGKTKFILDCMLEKLKHYPNMTFV